MKSSLYDVFYYIVKNTMSEGTNKDITQGGNNVTGMGDLESKKSGARGEIGEALQISTDPSKTPLNHINNLKQWESTLEEYKQTVRQQQKMLYAALELTEDKKKELDKYKEEKTALDIDLAEAEGTMYWKLSKYSDFINEIFEKVKDLLQDESEQVSTEQMNTGGKYQIPIQIRYDGENDKIFVTSARETTDSEQSRIIASLLNSFQEKGIDTTNTKVEFTVQPDINFDELNKENADVLEQYLKLVDPEYFDKVLKELNFSKKKKLKMIKKELEDLVDDYFDTYNQVTILSGKIDALQDSYNSYSDVTDGIQDEMDNMATDIENKGRTYFLNSYLSIKEVPFSSFVSSPLVEKQISNIIELNKKGLPLPKTILLYGKSNSGKSYAANVLATELGRKMYHIKSYDLFEGGYSDPNDMLDAIFTAAIKKAEPCIIFLDEIEDFAGGDQGSYQKLLENTIRHHVSKIKESSLDIIIIGAISNRNRVGQSLGKQDVFSKQIYFTPLSKDKYEKLFHTMLDVNDVNVGDDIDIKSLLEKIKESDLDQEYLKKLIAMAIDFHQLNDSSDSDNIILSFEDFNKARDFMSQYSHNVSQGVGFNNN